MFDSLNKSVIKPELSPTKLAWLVEMGVSPVLLKSYLPQANLIPKKVLNTGTKSDVHVSVNQNIQSHKNTQIKNLIKPAQNINPKKIVTEIQADNLLSLQQQAMECTKCQLHRQRDQLVFGAGYENQPDIMIVGEAPSKTDDALGYPFKGKAGKLLHFMLLSIGVFPNDIQLGTKPLPVAKFSSSCNIYFANLVKCRPLGNSSPDTEHIEQCYPYLQTQINLIKPRCILALGRLAAKYLLNDDGNLEDLRAKVHYITNNEQKIPVVATWHPASLLLQPQNKPLAWSDLQLIKAIINN